MRWKSIEDKWSENGYIEVLSVYDMEYIDWNTSLKFNYDDNKYFIEVFEHDFGYDNQELYVFGRGKYGGDFHKW